MKKALLTMCFISGLMLAGSEHADFTTQLFACTGGVMIFSAAAWGLIRELGK